MDLINANSKLTPTDKEPLHKDIEGEPCCEEWEYWSIVGIVLYLAGSTHLNIAYTVHQCARFSRNPQKSHNFGLKHIALCLKVTKTTGISILPDPKNMKIDLYADANFAGLYATKNKINLVSLKSWTGVLSTFGNVLILWISKIQSKTSLSILDAEYTALSLRMGDLVSACILFFELGKRMNYDMKDISHVSKVWENITGTEALVNSKRPIMNSRMKHFSINYHWFRSIIKPKETEILLIDTKDQRVDIFTKD